MKIKLSDYILENSISNSDVVDIEMEQLKARLDVCCELANYYIKQMNMGVVMEAAPAQQPPTMPTKDQLQQPSSSYTQDIDTDMPAGYKSTQSANNYETYSDSVRHVFQDLLSNIKDLTKAGGNIYGYITFDRPNQNDTYCFFYRPDAHLIGVYLDTNDVDDNYVIDHNNPYFVSASQKAIKHKLDIGGDMRSQVTKFIQDTINNIEKYYSNNDTQPQETPQQQETPQETSQQQQNPMSAKTVAALAGAIIALAAFISKFLGYLNRMTNNGLNLIRIKESIDASKKYIDMMHGMALNNNFNDNDFNEFARQFQELINLVERSIANSGNKPTDQRYTQNAKGLINSPEVKDMMSKIQQIQNARFKQQLDSNLQNMSPQNLQRFNSDFQRLKNGMTQMLESSMQEAKSASYQQFKPTQQTQTAYQSQQTQPPQQQQKPDVSTQGGMMMQQQG